MKGDILKNPNKYDLRKIKKNSKVSELTGGKMHENLKIPMPQESCCADTLNTKESCCAEILNANESCCAEPLNTKESCCAETLNTKESWISGFLETSIGLIPKISTKIELQDFWGALKVRFGINRMNYTVNPGIYAIGNPTSESPVLVTANYKLTFDKVRKALADENVWLLILNTKGVNVWCAAGKGTFGTNELINQITKGKLDQLLKTKTLILPQLGATGICAHEITIKTGFKVLYGPVRISDIKEYFANGNKATPMMRRVKFPLKDRLVLTPIEIINAFKTSIFIFGIIFLINFILINPFGRIDAFGYLGAIIVGCFFTPLLLPFIPGRPFAWKGFVLGMIWAISVIGLSYGIDIGENEGIRAIGYLLVLPAISSYYALNFTGSSTYTSLSGVTKEMKIAIPVLLIMAVSGTLLLLLNGLGIL